MQDLSYPEKRSIRNISIDRPQTLSSSAPTEDRSENADASHESAPKPMQPFTPRHMGPGRPWVKRSIWAGGALIAAIIAFVIIGNFFEGATVTVTPRFAIVSANETVTLGLSGMEGTIAYDVVEVSREESREVPATGQERIEQAAVGTIVIYNDYDESSQKLIKNTRFETPEGLVFRIRDAVTVPGRHKNASGLMVPGSVEAEVFADSPGEEYNIDLADFTIPGFKESNDPRYDKFYARSKTPMTGGFIGTVRTASESVTTTTRTELKEALSQTGADSLSSVIPEGFIILPETVGVTYEDLPNADGTTDGTVLIRMKANVRAVAIDGTKLASALARLKVTGYTGEAVKLQDPAAFTYTPTTQVSAADLPETFELTVSGSGAVVWTYDVETLRSDLAGIHRDMTDTVLGRHSAIQKADIVIRPFWRRSMPDDTETIDVVESTNELTS